MLQIQKHLYTAQQRLKTDKYNFVKVLMDGLMLFVHDQMFNSYFAMLKNVPDPMFVVL